MTSESPSKSSSSSNTSNHYVLFTGGRDYSDRDAVNNVLDFLRKFYGERLRVIHGAAPGLDSLTGDVCASLGISCRAYPADWKRNGKPAGFIRNQHMVDLLVKWRDEHGHSVQVISWPGGNGTDHCSRVAESAGLPVDYMPTTGSQTPTR